MRRRRRKKSGRIFVYSNPDILNEDKSWNQVAAESKFTGTMEKGEGTERREQQRTLKLLLPSP